MEGKELYNDDEELNPKSNKKEEDDDSEDFGLPEIEGDEESEKSDDLGDPFSEESWSENKPEEEEESYAYSEDSVTEEGADAAYAYSEENDEADTGNEYHSSYYEEEYGQKKSPVGWIIAAIIFVVLVVVGIFWWMNRETEPEQAQQPVVQQPVVREPEPEPEPVPVEPEPEPEPTKQPGVYEINEPTGRYHVIVASSIDKDLVMDYGKKLAKQGMTCNILKPRGNRKFHRLSVADYVSLNDAALKSEQLKSEFGDEVWVIRY